MGNTCYDCYDKENESEAEIIFDNNNNVINMGHMHMQEQFENLEIGEFFEVPEKPKEPGN
jgi:biotin carboxylase